MLKLRVSAPLNDILLIEDEAPKQAHIERFLCAASTNLRVRTARSVNSGLDAIEEQLPDLIVLDMSLPTFDISGSETGGRPRGYGGKEILRHMRLAELKCPVVVITGYEAFPQEAGKPLDLAQIRSELEREFSVMVHGVLHFNSTYDEWKEELQRVLEALGLAGGRGT